MASTEEVELAYRGMILDMYDVFKLIEKDEVAAYIKAGKIVGEAIKVKYPNMTENDIEDLYHFTYNKFVGYSADKNSVEEIIEDEKYAWFTDKNIPEYGYYWPRYKKYLVQYKGWDYGLVDSIDTATNKILANIGNPKSNEKFDKRGLVLGHVQSGKTANFTGLINKGFDVGYKLIIVLAGMHNDLRSQTQLRLNKEVIGLGIDGRKPSGVGLVSTNKEKTQVIESWTSVQQDIGTAITHGVKSLNKPILLVVKKQQDVLNNLIEILSASISLEKKSPSVLIIDDEADQASINSKKEEDPTTINLLIRSLLDLFDKSSYVGYTATPFANLLVNADSINEGNLAENIAMDLYPKDFLIALPEPKGYCGPDTFFNTTVDATEDRMFIRYLSDEDKELFQSMKHKSDAILFNSVPETMKQAIETFLIVIAIRNLRGQVKEHNSMLIHVSRFTDSQNVMAAVINEFFTEMADKISVNLDLENEVAQSLKMIYEEDFIDTQRSFDANIDDESGVFDIFGWIDVYKEIKNVVNTIEIMSINGESKDALEYEKYKENGLNVIAIGGNKLSRGLTLEGLSISYYYRLTPMYDTLLQMGRWFGFREGYLDLCRIYTIPEIADDFSHLSNVMTDLRQEFTKLTNEKIKPSEYAVRILDHSKMKLTSPGKMKNVTREYNYTGTLQQTRLFEKTPQFYKNNMNVTRNLIDGIEQKFVSKDDSEKNSTKYHIAYDVPTEKVIAYLKEYKTSRSATKVTSGKIKNYIERYMNKRAFRKFNIVVVDNTNSTLNSKATKDAGIVAWPVDLGKIQIESAALRSIKGDKSKEGSNVKDIGAIVSANQEFVDILEKKSDKKENLKLRDANNPALFIYPLHPQVKTFSDLGIEFSHQLVPIGIAFSFPAKIVNDEGYELSPQENEYVYNDTVEEKNNEN